MSLKRLACRWLSLSLVFLLLVSAAGPVTARGDLLEKDPLILPAACDHFGEMEDWVFSDIVVYTFLRKKDPHTEMLAFAQTLENYGLVVKSDMKTSEGDRWMELARDGASELALMWDRSEGRLLVAYEEDIVTLSRKQEETVLYLGMEKWSQTDEFVKQCGKVLGTTAEKASKLVSGDLSQKLTKDDKTVVALRWYSTARILSVTIYEESAAEKLGFTLKKEETVDPYDHVLPDLASFLNTKYTQDVWAYTHYVTCLISRSDKDAAVAAVLKLLQEPRYQMKQMGKKSDGEGTHYTFEYTGKNEDVDWVYLKDGGKYHAKLTVKPYGSNQTALIFYTHPEFYLKDPGTRWNTTDEAEEERTPATKPNDSGKEEILRNGETLDVREDITVRIKKGDTVTLHCTYDETNEYDVFEWSIGSGNSIISIDTVGRDCKITAKSKGTATIKMHYIYGYQGRDVLTGRMRSMRGWKDRVYTVIVE